MTASSSAWFTSFAAAHIWSSLKCKRNMDPLTVISLAGNVIQFVEFGTRLLGRAEQLYTSSAGTIAVHDELELVTTDLRALVTRLRDSSPKLASDLESSREEESSWRSLQQICDQAANVADELISKLGGLKLKEGRFQKLRCLHEAVKSLWSEKEIKALSERLSGFRDALKTRVLFSIRSTSLQDMIYFHVDNWQGNAQSAIGSCFGTF